MATQQELNVKFKVDATELKTGSDEAKRQVKDAATDMEASMKDVSKATDGITTATQGASQAVKQMEGQVASSSASMEKNLQKVSKQMGAMQLFNMGSRAVGMIGGAAANLATLNGDSDAANTINTVTNAGSNAMRGAAMGFAATGGNPLGAAVGGLIGAGSALLEAAMKQKEAAAALAQARGKELDDYLHNAVDEVKTRQEAVAWQKGTDEMFAKYSNGPGSADEIQKLIDAQTKHIEKLQGKYDAKVLEYANNEENGYSLNQEQQAILEKRAATLEKAKKILERYYEVLSRIQETEQQMSDPLNFGEDDWGVGEQVDPSWFDKSIELDEQQQKLKEGEATLASLQKELNGVASYASGTPTDALTRIGGGVGYASYNNSVEQVQRTISSDLKKLIENQSRQNQEIANKLDDLKWETTPSTFSK